MCLLELKGLQVVHCYHSAGELKTELTQLPLRITSAVSVAQRGVEQKREGEREREKEKKSSANKSEWKIYLKKKVPTWSIRNSPST